MSLQICSVCYHPNTPGITHTLAGQITFPSLLISLERKSLSIHQLLYSFLIGECAALVRMMRMMKKLVIHINLQWGDRQRVLPPSGKYRYYRTLSTGTVCSEWHFVICIIHTVHNIDFLYAWNIQMSNYNKQNVQYNARANYIDEHDKV